MGDEKPSEDLNLILGFDITTWSFALQLFSVTVQNPDVKCYMVLLEKSQNKTFTSKKILLDSKQICWAYSFHN